MSEDLYTLIFDKTTKASGDMGEKVEVVVDIYDSVDSLRTFEKNTRLAQKETPGTGAQEETPGTGEQEARGHRGSSVTLPRGSLRATAVCLGLLCVLLLAVITGLLPTAVTSPKCGDEERRLLQSLNANQTKEREILQGNLSGMTHNSQWYKLNFIWYYVSTEMKTWQDSRQDCLGRGADLVIINSTEEESLVISLFNKRVWIGLTDIEAEGTWMWVDGTPLTTRFWHSIQPDNGGKPNVGEEDCVEIYIDYNGPVNRWNDLSCGRTNYWICERHYSGT